MPVYIALAEFITLAGISGSSRWAVDAANEHQVREMIAKALANDGRKASNLRIAIWDQEASETDPLFDGVGIVTAIREGDRKDGTDSAAGNLALTTSTASGRTISDSSWITPQLWQTFFSPKRSDNVFLLIEESRWLGANSSIGDDIAAATLKGLSLYGSDSDQNDTGTVPWLIDLTCRGADRERPPTLFHKAVFGLPDVLKHCVILRTPVDLEGMRKNLRKLTRVQDTDGRWYYCRFWEPEFFLYLTLFLERRRLLAPLAGVSAFAVLIEGELITAEVDLSPAAFAPSDRAGDLDLLFDAGTAMVALKRARSVEAEFNYGCRPKSVYALARRRLSLRGMDYSFVAKCVDIAYAMLHFYKDGATQRLNDDIVTRCFDDQGDVQIFIEYLHGLCMFALIHDIPPDQLRSGVKF